MDSDSPLTQSPRTPGSKSKSRKIKAPAYTPEQRAFIHAASLETATADRVQALYNEKFPENKKETWDIRKERTKVIKGKKILEVKKEAAANLEVGKGRPLKKFVEKAIKQEEARIRNRERKREFEARANGLYVPKTPPPAGESLEENNSNFEAFLREFDADSEDERDRIEVAIEVERARKHNEGQMSSDKVLKEHAV